MAITNLNGIVKAQEQYQEALAYCEEQIQYWTVNDDPTEKQLPMYEELKIELQGALDRATANINAAENEGIFTNDLYNSIFPPTGTTVSKDGYL